MKQAESEYESIASHNSFRYKQRTFSTEITNGFSPCLQRASLPHLGADATLKILRRLLFMFSLLPH
jgi:hypothetical protein